MEMRHRIEPLCEGAQRRIEPASEPRALVFKSLFPHLLCESGQVASQTSYLISHLQNGNNNDSNLLELYGR